jgi:biopolymer transport protein ExbD/biopolymer transport protein TolR
MGMNAGGGTRGAVSDINVAPLIDVLLVLLIIFMVIVPVTAKGLNVLAPQPPKDVRPQPTDTIIVQVQSNGSGEPSYLINQTAVPKSELESRLAAIFSTRQEKVLFVKADSSIEFSKVAEVIDMGHQADVDDIGLMTPRIEAGQ